MVENCTSSGVEFSYRKSQVFSGKGIDFDPAGGGAANLLDDYEEGLDLL
jgi:hypothetical protein